MPYFTSPNERIMGPLPRKDILAVCSFLNRRQPAKIEACVEMAENALERLAAAARMQ